MDMSKRLEGRVAIVTGSGHGIGKAYAVRLASEGARLVVAELDERAGAETAEEIRGLGQEAIAVRTDVSDKDSVEAMAAAAMEKYGRIDALVNNAAIFSTIPMSRAPFDEIGVDEWDSMMRVNVRGCWLASSAVIKHMRGQQYGKIVNISSSTALRGSTSRIHYVSSKAAVIGFTKTLANEVGAFNICVNCVAPGSTLSEQNPDDSILKMRTAAVNLQALKRMQKPEDITGAIAFFCSADSDFITGQTLVVDGGMFMH